MATRKINLVLEVDWDNYDDVSDELIIEDTGILNNLKDGVSVYQIKTAQDKDSAYKIYIKGIEDACNALVERVEDMMKNQREQKEEYACYSRARKKNIEAMEKIIYKLHDVRLVIFSYMKEYVFRNKAYDLFKIKYEDKMLEIKTRQDRSNVDNCQCSKKNPEGL